MCPVCFWCWYLWEEWGGNIEEGGGLERGGGWGWGTFDVTTRDVDFYEDFVGSGGWEGDGVEGCVEGRVGLDDCFAHCGRWVGDRGEGRGLMCV